MSAVEEERDELGQELEYRQEEVTGTWWGRCPTCGDRKACVGLTGFTCPTCGAFGFDVVPDGCGAVVVRLADVEPELVTWLWPGRVPLGRLTILDGDPGLGKSALTLDIAARVTRGDVMPDGARGMTTPRGVVLLGCEDGLADTVRPRLDAAGADVERVVALQAVHDEEGRPRLPTIADAAAITSAARSVDAAILIVDPLSAFLGRGVDGHRDTDVRQALASLAELAEGTGLAAFCVRHLTKAGGSNPLYRGGGSIAIIAAARSGLLLACDPDDDDLRVLATTKCNLAPPQPSLTLRIDATSDALRVVWLGTSERSAGDLLASDKEGQTTRDEAVDLLRTELQAAPKPVRALRAASHEAGVSWRTMERAKALLGVESVKLGFDNGGWVWRLPSEDRQASWRTSEKPEVADFDLTARLSDEPEGSDTEGRQTESLAVLVHPNAANDVDEILPDDGGESG